MTIPNPSPQTVDLWKRYLGTFYESNTMTLWDIPDFGQLPALSIRQPWAWAITTVGKDIENRDWRTKYRGRFLIHAAKGCTQREFVDASSFIERAVADEYREKGIAIGWMDLERGGIVGIAEIVDCVDVSGSPWFMGKHGFVLRNAQPIEFVPCKGALSFFKPELPPKP